MIGWDTPDEFPALGEGEVHVWSTSLRVGESWQEELRAVLSIEELEKADRLIPTDKTEQSVVARATLRRLLARYTAVAAGALEFTYGGKGKPYLVGPEGAFRVSFNVAHSGDMALFAFARRGEIGVDLEHIRDDVDFLGVGQRFFSTSEYAVLADCDDEQVGLAFFRCWTRKEAYLKARGTGITVPLDGFDVTLRSGDAPEIVETRYLPGDEELWRLLEVIPDPAYVGALVVPRRVETVRCYRFA